MIARPTERAISCKTCSPLKDSCLCMHFPRNRAWCVDVSYVDTEISIRAHSLFQTFMGGSPAAVEKFFGALYIDL